MFQLLCFAKVPNNKHDEKQMYKVKLKDKRISVISQFSSVLFQKVSPKISGNQHSVTNIET